MLLRESSSHEPPAAPGAYELRRIWLCADDYGISPGVNAAIRDLGARGRINATSVMVVAPTFHRSEAVALKLLNTPERRLALGLHLTLTAPFRPLSEHYAPLRGGTFFSLRRTLALATGRRLNPELLTAEVAAQLRMFAHTFGRPPDFVDGHQHVHLFPQVRDAVLASVEALAPDAWVRQCGRPGTFGKRLRNNRKALFLDILSLGFRERAQARGLRTNAAFAGAYGFHDRASFAELFVGFLDELPTDSVIMCHPGHVDAELRRLDPLTNLREQEYAFFAAEGFPALLAAHRVEFAPVPA